MLNALGKREISRDGLNDASPAPVIEYFILSFEKTGEGLAISAVAQASVYLSIVVKRTFEFATMTMNWMGHRFCASVLYPVSIAII